MKRSRWAAALLALIVSVLLGQVAVSTPASADGYSNCIPIIRNGRVVDCIPIPVLVDYRCPTCPPEFALDFREYTVLPETIKIQYVTALTRGLRSLDQAALTTNPTVRQQLRAEALNSFTSAAGTLGRNTTVSVAQVGYIDIYAGVIRPAAIPWLSAAGVDIADGLTALQKANGGPLPDPWRDVAVAEFDEAYQELKHQVVIGP
ncbi:hypothetical protein AB0M95_34115 [Sphaerisporangium sp. NPDC051017]|uniref:hypothetical protein n=1 Tax=Sphaerisporangium sp. NPDC051017 TaxID=3154636 RepID=UPI0034317552